MNRSDMIQTISLFASAITIIGGISYMQKVIDRLDLLQKDIDNLRETRRQDIETQRESRKSDREQITRLESLYFKVRER